jgi:prepilin peptidase CpaA
MTWSAFAEILAGVVLACLLLAVTTDVANRIIPNWLVLVVLGAGLLLRLVSGPGPLWLSLLGAIVVLAVLSPLGARDLLGWGDIKLIAAVTFVVPAGRVISLLLAIALAGGLLSCLYLAIRFVLRRMAASPNLATSDVGPTWDFRRIASREGARILANEPMPYAVAIFGGVACGLAIR